MPKNEISTAPYSYSFKGAGRPQVGSVFRKKRDWTLKNGTESWKARLEKSLLEND